MKSWRSRAVKQLQGKITVPGDKSISHRAVMLASIAQGTSRIRGFLAGEDCLATLAAMRAMGVEAEDCGDDGLYIHGVGMHGLQPPQQTLDMGNSGTGMRLLCGLLSGQHFDSCLTGDDSLKSRPMKRVTQPLSDMGARIETSEQGTAPLRIYGVETLYGLDYSMPVVSAQVKSALLLAGMYAKGRTVIREAGVSRNHTELMLKTFSYPLEVDAHIISLQGGHFLKAANIDVAADISSAAFFIVAALIAEEADVLLQNIGINPTRSAVIDILQRMGADITISNRRIQGEENIADIRVRSSSLHGIDIAGEEVSIAIDEFPIIFIAAACAKGLTRLRGAAELRVKESDRIGCMEKGLKTLGIQCVSYPDGIDIKGGVLSGGRVHSEGDHRIAMSFAVAAICAQECIDIDDIENVQTSFPDFTHLANLIGMDIEEYES